MLKFFIRAIFFAVLVFGLIAFSSRLFLNKEKLQSIKSKELRSDREDIGIAFFGSSHAYTTFDPRVFENEIKVKAFNYGAPLQNLMVTLPVAEEVITKRNIRLGVVDIFQSTIVEPPLTERAAAFQYGTLDYMDLSLDKVEVHNRLYGKQKLLNVFPAIREHALWKERFFQPGFALNRDDDYYRGFKTQMYFDKKSWEKNTRDKDTFAAPQLIQSEKLSEGQKEVIDDIIGLFREKGVPLVFVSAPIHRRYMNDKYFTYLELIKAHFKEKGVAFIDYNALWDELNLHLYDFADISHLNSSGALKVSGHLANYIKTRFIGMEDPQVPNDKKLKANRYYHIDTGFKHVLGHQRITNNSISEKTGILEIAVFKDAYDRLEIVLIGDRLKDIQLKVSYEVPLHETRNIPPSVRNRIDGNTYVQRASLPDLKQQSTYTGFKYHGKEFKVVLADCPFTEISGLRISVGDSGPATRVFTLDHLQLKESLPTILP